MYAATKLTYQPANKCNEAVFRTLYRLNARIAHKMGDTMYLAVVRITSKSAATQLEQHIQAHLMHGELYCPMEKGIYYLQIFARSERFAQVLLDDITDCVPGASAKIKPVTK